MSLRKTDSADLRTRYPLYAEIGMALALLFLIAAFRIDLSVETPDRFQLETQDLIYIDEIQQTVHEEKPPPPPRPPIPVEVPNDEVLDEDELDLDAFLSIDEAPPLPPPPPPARIEDPEPEIFVIVEQPPVLIGGLGKLQESIDYPEMARRAGVEGKVFLQFVVDENGRVIDPIVTRGIGAGCDEAAIAAILKARFEPGRQRGQAVKVKFALPVTFRIK